MSKSNNRFKTRPPRRYEHVTIHFAAAQGFGTLNAFLDALSADYGGALLAILPAAVSSGLVVGNGQPQAQVVWNLVLQFPPGKSRPALAWLGQAPPAEEGAPP